MDPTRSILIPRRKAASQLTLIAFHEREYLTCLCFDVGLLCSFALTLVDTRIIFTFSKFYVGLQCSLVFPLRASLMSPSRASRTQPRNHSSFSFVSLNCLCASMLKVSFECLLSILMVSRLYLDLNSTRTWLFLHFK